MGLLSICVSQSLTVGCQWRMVCAFWPSRGCFSGQGEQLRTASSQSSQQLGDGGTWCGRFILEELECDSPLFGCGLHVVTSYQRLQRVVVGAWGWALGNFTVEKPDKPDSARGSRWTTTVINHRVLWAWGDENDTPSVIFLPKPITPVQSWEKH